MEDVKFYSWLVSLAHDDYLDIHQLSHDESPYTAHVKWHCSASDPMLAGRSSGPHRLIHCALRLPVTSVCGDIVMGQCMLSLVLIAVVAFDS